MKHVRRRIHELTEVRGNSARDLNELIGRLNPVFRGWGNCSRTGNSADKLNQLDSYVQKRVVHWQYRRVGQRARFRCDPWPTNRMPRHADHR
ncbi:MAG: group II intron maturase-specific domain-containing protein [Spirochaetaceae bacterium]